MIRGNQSPLINLLDIWGFKWFILFPITRPQLCEQLANVTHLFRVQISLDQLQLHLVEVQPLRSKLSLSAETKSSQNCAEYLFSAEGWFQPHSFCFFKHFVRNVIVFSGLRLIELGSISKWNQIHNQLEDVKDHLLLRSVFRMDKVSWRKNLCKKCWQMRI